MTLYVASYDQQTLKNEIKFRRYKGYLQQQKLPRLVGYNSQIWGGKVPCYRALVLCPE